MENSQVGPFRVLDKLGAHRRHHVYRAVQVEQDRHVALKFIQLPPDVSRDAALVKIQREATVLKGLKHANLVKVFGAGAEGDHIFFAQEIAPGESVAALLVRMGRFAPDLVVDYARQVASALEYLHSQDIIHSKLTTDKLIVDQDGRLRVADLRLNRSRKRRWDAARRATLETAAYMPPEQLLGQGATGKADLYALGIIMFEMVTGKLPFQPQTMAQLMREKQSADVPRVSSLMPGCPAWLDKLIFKLMSPEPRQRPHSARAVMMTLDEIKLVETNQLAAAEKINKGFSPLTADADRTEARRALGLKKLKPPPEERENPMQTVPVLAGGLIGITLIIALVVYWPFGAAPRDLMSQANQLMAGETSDDWRDARRLYTRVMQNTDDPELAQEAERLYFESRRKSMLHRLERGVAPLEKPEIRQLYRIEQEAKQGDLQEAIDAYRGLANSIDPEGDLRYVHWEALDRAALLDEQRLLATEITERIARLQAAVEASGANAPDQQALDDALAERDAMAEENPWLQRTSPAGPLPEEAN